MKEYIRIKSGMLLDQYEWAGGYKISPREHKVREKELKNNTAIEVVDFTSNDNHKSITRKK